MQDQGCLLRKTPIGEHHDLLVMFMRENGLKGILSRRARKSSHSSVQPDLFETGEVTINDRGAGKPAFLSEFIPISSHPGIARKYKALQLASRLAGFYEKNLVHMESYSAAWQLLHTALDSFVNRSQPETVYLKSIFVFASTEGYPVRENWLKRMPLADRNEITRLIQQPVDSIEVNSPKVEAWIRNLESYFLQHTDLLVVNSE